MELSPRQQRQKELGGTMRTGSQLALDTSSSSESVGQGEEGTWVF